MKIGDEVAPELVSEGAQSVFELRSLAFPFGNKIARRDFVAVMLGLSDAELQTQVAATPAWSVRDGVGPIAV